MKNILFTFLCFPSLTTFSQDTLFVKVHFLYGSKPLKEYKSTEPKWFGGIMGGHAGLESDSNQVLNFVHSGSFHWFGKKNIRHSHYSLDSERNFYGILGGNPDSVKKAIVYIPISTSQKQLFDSISNAYVKEVPYDYAFFGMRCGAATYEILGQLGLLPGYSRAKTSRIIFYPKKLRKRLFKKAKPNGWKIERYEGTTKRKWEKD